MRPSVLLAIALGACAGPEPIPADRVRPPPRTGAELFVLVQELARVDRDEEVRAHLTRRSRDELGTLRFAGLLGHDLPDPYDAYTLGEVIRGGKLVAETEGMGANERFVYAEYEEPGGPNLLARILIIHERYLGSMEPRIAVKEQWERIDRGELEYHWDAGR